MFFFFPSLKCLEAEETPSTKTDTFVKLTCHISNQTNFLLPGLKDALEEPLTKKNESLGREAKYPQYKYERWVECEKCWVMSGEIVADCELR